MKSSLERFKDTELKFDPLYKRFDKDAGFAYLNKYNLKTWDGQDLYGAVSVTLNDPAVFLNAIISWIMASKWQIKIWGDIPPTTERKIEKFNEDTMFDVDERLVKKRMPKLFHFLATHICARGWIGSRNIWRLDKDDKPYLDVLPMDMRYFSYEMGTDMINHGGYRTRRSPEAILKEYGPIEGLNTKGKENLEVIDTWDDKWNDVWIEEKLALHVKNKDGYPPITMGAAPQGFMLLDKGYLVHEGESIFFLNRDLYPVYNQLVSIDQTIALKQVDPTYQFHRAPGSEQGAKKVPVPDATGAVYDLKPGDPGYELIQQPDLKTANLNAHSNIKAAVESGGISEVELGSRDPMPPSALLVTEQAEIRNKIQKPRLEALESYYVQLYRMSIDQYTRGNFSGEIGRRGRKTLYTASGFGDPETYDIELKLMTKTRRQEIANLAIARTAKGVLPRKTIIEEIMMADDPEGMIAMLDAEDAERFEPALKYFRMALGAAREAKTLKGTEKKAKQLESMMLSRAMVRQLNQVQQQPQEEQAGKSQIPLGLKEGGI